MNLVCPLVTLMLIGQVTLEVKDLPLRLFFFCIAGAPKSWRSKKQDSVALSTAEAEYKALSSAAQESLDEMTQLLI